MSKSAVLSHRQPTGLNRQTGTASLALVSLVLAIVGAIPAVVVGQTEATPTELLKALTGLMGEAQQQQQQQSTDEQAQQATPRESVDYEPAESGDVTQTDSGLLDLHVRDMALSTLLEMISYQARANIVTSTSVTGQVSANLYDVTLEQALDAILTPNQYSFRTSGSTIFVGTNEEIADLRPPPVTRVFKLRFIGPDEAVTAIKALLGEEAEVVAGGGDSSSDSSSSQSGGMSPAGVDYVIVTDYADHLTHVEALLRDIDQRPQQVLIEATILRATLNESNEFGIDFTFLGGVDFQNVGGTSNAATNLTLGQLPPADLQSTTFNISTDFAGPITGGGLTFGLIKDNVAAFIRALEEVTDVVVVANPKIVATNKQEAEVIVGRRDGYLTTTVTETAAVQTVEFLETGTQIKFQPSINEDGTVRLNVHPKDSNGGLTAANLPFEETTEAQTCIVVNDGETVLIGGLFRERTIHSKTQLPVLGNIPGLGLLFGAQGDSTVREEVIILLTVHVLKNNKREQQQYTQLLDDIEQMRVGCRRGLLESGRERLAQAYYHEALTRLEAGDRKRALLNVRMTINNQPKHLAAIKLRDQLLNNREWDEEGSRMRSFIWDLIGHGNAPGATPDRLPFGRSIPQTEAQPPANDSSQEAADE